MNITGKINLFVKERETKDKNGKKIIVKDLSTTISRKDSDGNYINAYIEVKFCGDEENKAKLEKALAKMDEDHCYPVEVEGFLSFRNYEKDDKTFTVWQLIIQSGLFDSPIEISKKSTKKESKKDESKKTTKKPSKKQEVTEEEIDDLPF